MSGMFDTVNDKVSEIAGEVGQTPLNWNSGVYSMIRNLSESVIVPIACDAKHRMVIPDFRYVL